MWVCDAWFSRWTIMLVFQNNKHVLSSPIKSILLLCCAIKNVIALVELQKSLSRSEDRGSATKTPSSCCLALQNLTIHKKQNKKWS